MAGSKKGIGFNLEGRCEPLNVVQCDVPGASLYMGNERSVKPGLQCEVFLRPALRSAHEDEVRGQRLARAFATFERAAGRRRHHE